jgi:hypothetical protein
MKIMEVVYLRFLATSDPRYLLTIPPGRGDKRWAKLIGL